MKYFDSGYGFSIDDDNYGDDYDDEASATDVDLVTDSYSDGDGDAIDRHHGKQLKHSS